MLYMIQFDQLWVHGRTSDDTQYDFNFFRQSTIPESVLFRLRVLNMEDIITIYGFSWISKNECQRRISPSDNNQYAITHVSGVLQRCLTA